jgi:hypothetical protein
MKLCCYEPHTDDVTGQLEKSLLDLREPIQPTPQPAESMQPGYGPLHEPTEHTQATAMLRVALDQVWSDSQPTQNLPPWFAVIGTITLQPFRFLPFAARRRCSITLFIGLLGMFLPRGVPAHPLPLICRTTMI